MQSLCFNLFRVKAWDLFIQIKESENNNIRRLASFQSGCDSLREGHESFICSIPSLHWIWGNSHSRINSMEETGHHPLTQMCFVKNEIFLPSSWMHAAHLQGATHPQFESCLGWPCPDHHPHLGAEVDTPCETARHTIGFLSSKDAFLSALPLLRYS